MIEFIRSWRFMLIIILLLTFACAGLVVYGVTTHTEGGFATADTPIADGFVPPEYPHRPIGVCVQSYPPGHGATADDMSLVGESIGIVNGRVGLALLDAGDIRTHGGCLIVVTVGAPVDVDAGQHHDPGGASGICGDSCCIGTMNTGTTEMTSLSLQHEIGHCLGLVHDDYAMSIMYSRLAPSSGTYPPRISDSDRDLLRARYGRD